MSEAVGVRYSCDFAVCACLGVLRGTPQDLKCDLGLKDINLRKRLLHALQLNAAAAAAAAATPGTCGDAPASKKQATAQQERRFGSALTNKLQLVGRSSSSWHCISMHARMRVRMCAPGRARVHLCARGCGARGKGGACVARRRSGRGIPCAVPRRAHMHACMHGRRHYCRPPVALHSPPAAPGRSLPLRSTAAAPHHHRHRLPGDAGHGQRAVCAPIKAAPRPGVPRRQPRAAVARRAWRRQRSHR